MNVYFLFYFADLAYYKIRIGDSDYYFDLEYRPVPPPKGQHYAHKIATEAEQLKIARVIFSKNFYESI